MADKEKSCLITNHLISSIDWARNAPDSIIKSDKGGDGSTTWRSKAEDDLRKTLSREPTDFPEAARRGVEFEKKVYQIANREEISDRYSDEFRKVCDLVRGYSFGQKGGRDEVIEGNSCYLYAKYDAIWLENEPIKIRDIKTTENYRPGKYLESFQHILYCYIGQAVAFDYVIAEWGEYPKVKRIEIESFTPPSEDALKQLVFETVGECLEYLQENGLWEIYRGKYCLY